MATQSELLQAAASPKAQALPNGLPDVGTSPNATSEPEIAWEIVKDECHDVLEQLPLTLRRNFKLMKDLDKQVAAHLQAIPSVLQEYLQLRVKLAQDVVMADVKPNDDAAEDPQAARDRPISRASFSSASLTPITESPSTRSGSLPNAQDDSTNFMDDEEETEEPDTSFESHPLVSDGPTSTQLIGRVATLATDAVRGSHEKVNLANAAFKVIDRHVRALDIAIAEQETAIAMGVRQGTRPAAIVAHKGTSPSHTHSQSFESNGLLALAEVASAVAEKTLESLLPLPMTETASSTFKEKERESTAEDKPGKRLAETNKITITNRTTQPKRDRKKRNAAAAQNGVLGANEPTYCFCNQVSFGNMIACDGPNCQREWFHWGCVGIKHAPTASKWYCRDCEAKEPARKRRKR